MSVPLPAQVRLPALTLTLILAHVTISHPQLTVLLSAKRRYRKKSRDHSKYFTLLKQAKKGISVVSHGKEGLFNDVFEHNFLFMTGSKIMYFWVCALGNVLRDINPKICFIEIDIPENMLLSEHF